MRADGLLPIRKGDAPAVARTVGAAGLTTLGGVQFKDVTHVTDDRIRRAHFANFRIVCSCTEISLLADARTRSFRDSFAGRMISASPSVRTSRRVSFVMLKSSRIGRSMMSPRLLPTEVSFLRKGNLVLHPFERKNIRSAERAQAAELEGYVSGGRTTPAGEL